MNLFIIHNGGKVHRIRAMTVDLAWKKIHPTMVGYQIEVSDKVGKRFIIRHLDVEIAKITKIPKRRL